MAILKLIPGQRINFTVEGVSRVDGNFGPQYKFIGQTPDDGDAALFLNIATADRQMDRLGYDAESIVGETIEVERTEKNGTKYTNFNRSNASPAHPVMKAAGPGMPQPAAKPVSTSGKQPYESGPRIPAMDGDVDVPKLDRLFGLYSACLDHVLAVEVPKLNRASIGASPEAVGAMTATLLIQASKL
jgi:hypothetical protein